MVRVAIHLDADIDIVGERDDIAAMALWLATQDTFNMVGFTQSPPDGNVQEYLNCIDAYEADRPTMIEKGANPLLFKPAQDLRDLVLPGVTEDAPSRGYWLSGETGYANVHAAAQLMIANAQAHGDPTGGPGAKLWIAVQGGFATLAQAAYEAVQLGQLPDFWDRVRVIAQPNWNSGINGTTNCWNYLFLNSDPGEIHQGMWMICGYLQWHGFNRNNGGSDVTFWNAITANSWTGQHLRDTLTRPGASFTAPHFRAGDAGAWVWLLSAITQDNFDPGNVNNWCGHYRTYAGVDPWPSQTVGYGSGSGLGSAPNPEGVTLSTTIWAPELTVDSFEAGEDAVDLAQWYSMVPDVMAIYQAEEEVLPTGLLTEWLMDTAGSIPSQNGAVVNGLYAASPRDPSVDAFGTDFDGDDYARATMADSALLNGMDDAAFVAIIEPRSNVGDQIFFARDAGGTSGHFQFRTKNGNLQFLDRRQTTTTVADPGTVVTGDVYLVSATIDNGMMTLRKNGAVVATVPTSNTPYNLDAELTFGCRQGASSGTQYVNNFDGRIAYLAIWNNYPASQIEEAEFRALQATADRDPRIAAMLPAIDSTGTLQAQETGTDVAAGAGAVVVETVTGTVQGQEAGPDSTAGTGAVDVAASLQEQDSASDTLAASGAADAIATLEVQEGLSDTVAGNAAIDLLALIVAMEQGGDTAFGIIEGAASAGAIGASETGSDTAEGQGSVDIAAMVSAKDEGADTASLTAEPLGISAGTLAASEDGPDTAGAAGFAILVGILAAAEAEGDVFNGGNYINAKTPPGRVTSVPAMNRHARA